MSENEHRRGRWKPGQTGNPKGRPPGQSEITRLRAAIVGHVPAIVDQLVRAARGGDVGAARLLLERVLPPIKAVEQAQSIELPEGSLTDKGRAVLSAVAAGNLAPSQGAQLLAAIGNLGKVAELDELAERVALLEQANEKS
jgi:hypothetical protein